MREYFDELENDKELEELIERKIIKYLNKKDELEEPKKEKPKPHHHIHHLEEKNKKELKEILDINRDFDELLNIFEDEPTAEAIVKIMKESPTEIQVVVKLIIELSRKIDMIIN